MENAGARVLYTEGFLRLFSLVFAVMAAAILGFNQQTKEVFLSIEKKATSKDLKILWILSVVAPAVAGYHFLHLCRCLMLARVAKDHSRYNKWEAGLYFALDQAAMYALLAATAAGAQGALFAVFGESPFQWMKLCNIYTRFCENVGGGLFCSLVASLGMSCVSMISAHHLFRPPSASKDSSFAGGSCCDYN